MKRTYQATIEFNTDLDSIHLDRAKLAEDIQQLVYDYLLERFDEENLDATVDFTPTFAYTAVYTGPGATFGIGKADQGESGYTPCPQFGNFPTFDKAMETAESLNTELGLTSEESARIVASSMKVKA